MRQTFFTFCFFALLHTAKAQLNIALAIPDSMKANAHSVIRLYEETFTVKNAGEATRKIHYIVTVLDQRGQDYATVSVFHDKHTKINDMEAVVYDAFGKQVKKVKRGDIVDVSYASGGTLFSDNKIKTADLKYANYPYTIEVTEESTTQNLLFFPTFFPQRDAKTTVENARLEIVVPNEVGLRFKAFNGIAAPVVSDNNDVKSYGWAVKNLVARTPEDLSTQYSKYGPGVMTAPVF